MPLRSDAQIDTHRTLPFLRLRSTIPHVTLEVWWCYRYAAVGILDSLPLPYTYVGCSFVVTCVYCGCPVSFVLVISFRSVVPVVSATAYTFRLSSHVHTFHYPYHYSYAVGGCTFTAFTAACRLHTRLRTCCYLVTRTRYRTRRTCGLPITRSTGALPLHRASRTYRCPRTYPHYVYPHTLPPCRVSTPTIPAVTFHRCRSRTRTRAPLPWVVPSAPHSRFWIPAAGRFAYTCRAHTCAAVYTAFPTTLRFTTHTTLLLLRLPHHTAFIPVDSVTVTLRSPHLLRLFTAFVDYGVRSLLFHGYIRCYVTLRFVTVRFPFLRKTDACTFTLPHTYTYLRYVYYTACLARPLPPSGLITLHHRTLIW